MLSTRWRRLLLIVVPILATVTLLIVTAETIVRTHLDAALASRTADIPGVDLSAAGGLALWSLAIGRVDIEASVDDAAVQSIVECRTGRDVAVSTTPEGISVDVEIELRGRTMPASVLLLPRTRDEGWTLVPRTVDVGGLSFPPERVAPLLGDRAPAWLGTGIPLPSAGGMSVTNVVLTDGAAHFFLSAPLSGGAHEAANVFAGGECDR